MRWIYISPHFDDAVLSCGGLIWEQTQASIPVEIWTINAGDPPLETVSELITRVHAMWKTGSPQETVRQRRIEDQNAAKQVGAKLIHYPMVDAIYRSSNLGDFF
jgi:LmbE family N-acetylglucosaminyl deacetylase